jgi:hypothetical protein
VTNFFFTNKRQEITKNQTAISNRRSILKHKTLAKLFLYTSCLMTLSKRLRCCNCNACNWFSNSEADEFRKYSFCSKKTSLKTFVQAIKVYILLLDCYTPPYWNLPYCFHLINPVLLRSYAQGTPILSLIKISTNLTTSVFFSNLR